MIAKFIGSVLILLSSTGIGLFYAKKFAERPVQLRDLQAMLAMFENEVAYMSNTIRESFSQIIKDGNRAVACIFKDTLKYLGENQGYTANEAWERALHDSREKLSLTREDMLILSSFGKSLGSTDVEGQIRNIRMTQAQLKHQEVKAEDSKRKNERLYKNLGILIGLAVVIILI